MSEINNENAIQLPLDDFIAGDRSHQVLERMCFVFEDLIEAYFNVHNDPLNIFKENNNNQTLISNIETAVYDEVFQTELSYLCFDSTINFNDEQYLLTLTAAFRLLFYISTEFDFSTVVQNNINHQLRIINFISLGIEPLSSFSSGVLANFMCNFDLSTSLEDSIIIEIIKRLYYLQSFEDSSSIIIDNYRAITSTNIVDLYQLNSNRILSNKLEFVNQQNFFRPLTIILTQKLYLQFLQEVFNRYEYINIAMDNYIMNLLMNYLNPSFQTDDILALQACLTLASLLTHKKFIYEFIAFNGVKSILKINRTSKTASAVTICLYHLAFNIEAYNKIANDYLLIREMNEYSIWVIQNAPHNAKCYAALFFSASFLCRTSIECFDSIDGFKTLINSLSLFETINFNSELDNLTIFYERIRLKNISLSIKRYFQCQLAIKIESMQNSNGFPENDLDQSFYNLPISSPSAARIIHLHSLESYLDLLERQNNIMIKWKPIEIFKKNQGFLLISKHITHLNETVNFSAKNEMLRVLLEIIAIVSLNFASQSSLIEYFIVRTEHSVSYIKIVLNIIEDLTNVELKMIAFRILVHCTLSFKKDMKNRSIKTPLSFKTLKFQRNFEDMQNKLLSEIASLNGINILIDSMLSNNFPCELYKIRYFACRVLYGLTKCLRVKQIMSKLPFFNSGQLQLLIEEPIQFTYSNYHELFCQYGCLLLNTLSNQFESNPISLVKNASISRTKLFNDRIVNKSRIKYDKEQFIYVMSRYLMENGYRSIGQQLHDTVNYKEYENKMNGTSLKNEITSKMVSLDEIVKCYLRFQHSQCPNPITTCATFSLIEEHHCPIKRRSTRTNMIQTLFNREIQVTNSSSQRFFRNYFYNRPLKVFQDFSIDGPPITGQASCCRFDQSNHLFIGNEYGNVYIYEPDHTEFDFFQLRKSMDFSNYISNIEVNKKGTVIIVCESSGVKPTTVWSIDSNDNFNFTKMFELDAFKSINISPMEDKIVCSLEKEVQIVDLVSGTKLISGYYDSTNSNKYEHNEALINRTEDLLLNEGCLWDFKNHKIIHRFDKFDNICSGIFHSNDLEIIIGSGIWDLRTFKLLRTCSYLEKSFPIFSHQNDVVYSVAHNLDDFDFQHELRLRGPYFGSVNFVDPVDYSLIGGHDFKNILLDFNVSYDNRFVAVVDINEKHSNDVGCRIFSYNRINDEEMDDVDEGEYDDDENNNIFEEFDLSFSSFDDSLDSDVEDSDQDTDGGDSYSNNESDIGMETNIGTDQNSIIDQNPERQQSNVDLQNTASEEICEEENHSRNTSDNEYSDPSYDDQVINENTNSNSQSTLIGRLRRRPRFPARNHFYRRRS